MLKVVEVVELVDGVLVVVVRLADRHGDGAPGLHLRARYRVLAVHRARARAAGAGGVEGGVGHQARSTDGRLGRVWRLPDHARDRGAVPVDTTRFDRGVGGPLLPAPGVWDDTSPAWYWFEHALVCLPTFRPAPFRMEPADAGDSPTTVGTVTEVWVPDTVSCTLTFALTLAPPAGFWSAPFRWAGCCSRT